MKKINVCDVTLCQNAEGGGLSLTFRKKTDVAALLDRMQISVVELGEVAPTTEGKLLVKSIAAALTQSTLCVSVGCDGKNAAFFAEALKGAKRKRLQVSASLSTSRMEYVYHKKANDMLASVTEAVRACAALCDEVEFYADDATRADPAFLRTVLAAAIDAGAAIVSVADTSGNMLPAEFGDFLRNLCGDVKGLSGVALGVSCSNRLGLADAMAVEALRAGAVELKASLKKETASLAGIAAILSAKAETLGVQSAIGAESFARDVRKLETLCNLSGEGGTPFEDGVRDNASSVIFTEQDGEDSLNREIEGLGYDLSEEDKKAIFAAFKQIISKKKQIDLHELEVIVASESMQVPQAYKLADFVVTTGSTVDTVAHVKLERDGKNYDGVSLGNGSVDASFLAIEKILGTHYELDDFQIQAITEGKEAMGQTLVKLRSHGKVYSGRGVSTDIVLSAVNAYLNALNKIVYEEERL